MMNVLRIQAVESVGAWHVEERLLVEELMQEQSQACAKIA
jgi:hypothetical protein